MGEKETRHDTGVVVSDIVQTDLGNWIGCHFVAYGIRTTIVVSYTKPVKIRMSAVPSECIYSSIDADVYKFLPTIVGKRVLSKHTKEE